MNSLLPDVNPAVNAIIDQIERKRRLCGRDVRKGFYVDEQILDRAEPFPRTDSSGRFMRALCDIKRPEVRLLDWCQANDVDMRFFPTDPRGKRFGFIFGPPPEFFRLTDTQRLALPIIRRIEYARMDGIACGALRKSPNVLYLDHGASSDVVASCEITPDRMLATDPYTYKGMIIRSGEQEGPGVAVEYR